MHRRVSRVLEQICITEFAQDVHCSKQLSVQARLPVRLRIMFCENLIQNAKGLP